MAGITVKTSGWEAATQRAVSLTQKQIVTLAKGDNQVVMTTEPRPLGFTRYVDGVKDAPEESVKPGGVIVYDYNRLDQVAEFALETLRELSPVDSGDYVRSHEVLINGEVVTDFSGWKPGDVITISNPLPYVRKIEIGNKGFRAHGHVYEKAERIVSRRYGNLADVFFTYRTAPPGDIHEWAARTGMSHQGHASTVSRQEWLTRQPTLVIQELGGS